MYPPPLQVHDEISQASRSVVLVSEEERQLKRKFTPKDFMEPYVTTPELLSKFIAIGNSCTSSIHALQDSVSKLNFRKNLEATKRNVGPDVHADPAEVYFLFFN